MSRFLIGLNLPLYTKIDPGMNFDSQITQSVTNS